MRTSWRAIASAAPNGIEGTHHSFCGYAQASAASNGHWTDIPVLPWMSKHSVRSAGGGKGMPTNRGSVSTAGLDFRPAWVCLHGAAFRDAQRPGLESQLWYKWCENIYCPNLEFLLCSVHLNGIKDSKHRVRRSVHPNGIKGSKAPSRNLLSCFVEAIIGLGLSALSNELFVKTVCRMWPSTVWE